MGGSVSTTETTHEPFFLRDNYAPVTEEVTATDLDVVGAIPPELVGRYLRNGPNPQSQEGRLHWFIGDGMLHGIELGDGNAKWYRNRWVDTKRLRGEGEFVDAQAQVDRAFVPANTHVVRHAGRIMALVEVGFPYEVTPELATVGPYDFGGKLTGAMTAHPKFDPETGEMLFFGYGFFPPYLEYHVVDAAGQLVRSEEIAVKGPTMIHDWGVTARNIVWMDLPMVFDLEIALTGGMPYRWDDDYGARLGIMPRSGGSDDVVWIEIDPCYVFHPMNAYEDGDVVVMDVARYPYLWRGDGNEFPGATLWQWTIDAAAGTVAAEQLDDTPIEFPRLDDRRAGLSYRYGYAVETDGNVAGGSRSPIRFDLETGAVDRYDLGDGCQAGEPVFVPAGPDAAEAEGWLMTFVYDAGRDGSNFVIWDASAPGTPPVATVALPQRVPFGFHGSWIPDERQAGSLPFFDGSGATAARAWGSSTSSTRP